MKYILLIVLRIAFGNIGTCVAQELQVLILDSVTKRPIPYATIVSGDLKAATYADAQGVFRVPKEFSDTLFISSVGYEKRTVKRSVLADNKIYLTPKVVELNSVTMKARKLIGEDKIGVMNAKKAVVWNSTGTGEAFAQKIFLPDISKLYKIKTVFIEAERYEEEIPVMLHIFNTRSDGLPGTDILLKNILLKKEYFKKSKRQFIIDLGAENILLTGPSCFIGFEWLPTLNRPIKASTGIILTTELAERLTYAKSAVYLGDDWIEAPTLQGKDGRPTNTIISVKVEVFK